MDDFRKISIGSDWTFFSSCIIHTTGPTKNMKILQLFVIRVAVYNEKNSLTFIMLGNNLHMP